MTLGGRITPNDRASWNNLAHPLGHRILLCRAHGQNSFLHRSRQVCDVRRSGQESRRVEGLEEFNRVRIVGRPQGSDDRCCAGCGECGDQPHRVVVEVDVLGAGAAAHKDNAGGI